MQLYSKKNATALIGSMIRSDRLFGAFILYGEKGVGKRTLAKYIAQAVFCDSKTGVPCGQCRNCKNVENLIHPDFITVSGSGKNGNYLASDLRSIVSDSVVAPNDSATKIYFLPEIDKTLPAAQNVLLKIVEEPPPHVVFVMTAESREKILPTILSRAMSIAVGCPTEAECSEELSLRGFTEPDIANAQSLYGGNIGKCIEYLISDEAKIMPKMVENIVSAMNSKDEYRLMSALSSLESDREMGLEVLSALKDVLRDAAAVKLGVSEYCSVCRDGAKELAKNLRQSSIEKLYSCLLEAEERISGNGYAAIIYADLCSKLSTVR